MRAVAAARRAAGCAAVALLGAALGTPAGGAPRRPHAAARPAPQADTSRVVVIPIASRVLGNTRALRVYLPPGAAPGDTARRFPALYLNDGFAVMSPRGWNARRTLDSLIAARAVAPMVVVAIDNAASIPGIPDPGRARADEYLPYPDATEPDLPSPRGGEYARFVVEEVVPLVERSFPVQRGAAHRGIGGSSYGAVAALVSVLRYPGVFGALLLESPPLFLFRGRLVDEAAALPTWPAAVHVGLGTRETDDAAVSAAGRAAIDRFVRLAGERSPATRVRLHVVEGATHTSAAWGARLPEALRFVYAPAPR